VKRFSKKCVPAFHVPAYVVLEKSRKIEDDDEDEDE
jgi:hypothetical protein